MKHARDDYDRFQDPLDKIPEDEPVFLLRAQDKHFVIMLDLYISLVDNDPGKDARMLNLLYEHRERAVNWQDQHGCKTPDLP